MKALKMGLLALAMPLLFKNSSNAQQWKPQHVSIPTRWAAQVNVDHPLPEYPRPQLERKSWQNLNGLWEYSITAKNAHKPGKFSSKILVPYSVESALSGVKKQLKPEELLWYKRMITQPKIKPGEKVLLNFGAVDFEATVYINGKEVGKHTGGYQNFSFDVTETLKPGNNELLVKVWDPSDRGPNPHGKQVLKPEGIMYTPSSGIWQTVWLETVPATYIHGLKVTPDVDKASINVIVSSATNAEVILTAAGTTVKGKTNTAIPLPIQKVRLWSPDDPYLYDLTVRLGKDEVKSYFGMRKIEVKKDEKGIDRIFLNGKYTFNLGTLDQGFWPDGLYTAPTDEALVFDIKASKAMGFNTIRKHIKVEPARWYFHADKLGMLVWQDMVNPGNDTPEGRSQFEKENQENIAQLYNHPSIVTWVLFNEKWGQYDQERLTKELKVLDPTRLINGHSGEMLYVNDALRSPSPDAWVGADMTDVHAYPSPGYLKFEKGKAAVIGEFGGIGVPIEGHLWDDLKAGWGYDGVVTPPVLREQYEGMVDSLKRLEVHGLTASIYTQPFDVETEQNGLMTYDREVIKLPVEIFKEIHSKLWPITKNYVTATKGFSALVADTISKTYSTLLKEYHQGKRDSAFLRKIALMAERNKDTTIADSASDQYIQVLNKPLLESNVNFIAKYTRNTRSKGFQILLSNIDMTNEILGEDITEAILTRAIEADEITPYMQKGNKPDWDSLEKISISKYGDLGQESVWTTKMFYSINHNNWEDFAQIMVPWLEKYGKNRSWFSPGMINGMAWRVFENTNNKAVLEAAAMISAYGLNKENTPNLLDTYANLLYKLGKTTEALIWQEKAIVASGGDAEIKSNYEKMKRAEPTWPEIK